MNCSSQVGPDSFGYYYCTGKAYGQCDRRTGTCYCNLGYQGENCTDCSLDYHKVGQVCEQKKRCPNDCSGHGTCDYSTGNCTCVSEYKTADCSIFRCKQFHKYCEACTEQKCVRCKESYFVDGSSACQPCTSFDPRCLTCNSTNCLACADNILKSVRRSGRRKADSVPPAEE